MLLSLYGTVKFLKVYGLGFDVTQLRNNDNKIIKYLNSHYDEMIVLVILYSLSAVIDLVLCLWLGEIGQIISAIDQALSVLSSYFILKNGYK